MANSFLDLEPLDNHFSIRAEKQGLVKDCFLMFENGSDNHVIGSRGIYSIQLQLVIQNQGEFTSALELHRKDKYNHWEIACSQIGYNMNVLSIENIINLEYLDMLKIYVRGEVLNPIATLNYQNKSEEPANSYKFIMED